ncbi:DNA polymerase III subunit gamma/tau [Salinisphaera orenii]|uniref:DNA polymerase III subunit gamma/tau n=1 Tax=Salinisphaera orenii YIM 95161 TaxID=1051139 RepID=A0A423Q1P8_9GAMM|nr:DNA polymerase III subunit gamma/tau [Salinisphaera halophila]ROO32395.1 ATPase AAA [Salinisphaera halophila YIM 95161]
MSFQALARTWRPRRFDELVGQTHVVRALTHALEQDQLHHALLFSGTRGVGKTTLARIIAKCLNCEHGVTAHPCRGDDACGTCREIDEGRFVDLIEVDAASRTGVDDTRDLMDNVQYAPTRGRSKVYLIDEVHMLSKHSFNALLKTLEEPPPRVQFLLATTEPEKIPVTILSRCLQFPLKRLPVAEISAQLQTVVDAESLSVEEGALTEIARAADGSMRDGLSLLDQAIAFGGGRLESEAVREMLGTLGQARVAELVTAIVDADAATALEALAALYAQGIDMRYLLDALATAWQHIATIQIVGDVVDEEAEPWRETAARADAATVQVLYDITLAGVRDLAHAPDPLVGVKMTVLRMLAFVPAGAATGHSNAPGGSERPAKPRAEPARSGPAALREQLGRSTATGSHQADTPATPQATAEEPVANGQAGEPNGQPAARPSSPQETSTVPAADSSPPEPPEPAPETPPPAVSSKPPAEDAEPGTAVPRTESKPDAATAPSPTPTPTPTPTEATPVAEPKPERETESEAAPAAEPAPATEATPAEPAGSNVEQSSTGDDAAGRDHPEDWHALVPRLEVSGFGAQLANNGVCRHLDEKQVVLELARSNEFLATAGAKRKLEAALAAYWAPQPAPKLSVEFVDEARDTPAQRQEQDAEARQRDAIASIENDPFVHRLRDRLGAQLRADTIKPNRRSAAAQQREER